MDRYSQHEDAIRGLKKEIVNDIRETLGKKGYRVGDRAYRQYGRNGYFEILSDRLLVNDRHTDNLTIEELMEAYGDALRAIPKT